MYLIVGVDPGTTVGVAILDFEGRVVNLFSSKNMGLNEVIKHISGFGRVSVIANDVDHVPDFVYKVASSLDAEIFIPETSLLVSEKVELTKDYKFKDTHQRDSLSAAIYAYKRLRNKFEKISALGYGDDVKHFVIKGFSISNAVNKIYHRTEEIEKSRSGISGFSESSASDQQNDSKSEVSSEEFRDVKERTRILEKTNYYLKKEIDEKREEIENLNRKIRDLERKFTSKIEGSEEVRDKMLLIKTMEISLDSMRRDIKGMEKNIENLREVWNKMGRGEILPVGVFPEIFSGLTLIKGEADKKNVLLSRVEIAFTENPMKSLPCRVYSKDYVHEFMGFAYIEKEKIQALKQDFDLMKLVEDYKKSRKKI